MDTPYLNLYRQLQNVLDQTKNNWISHFLNHVQSVWSWSKTILTCPKQFGPVKGQGKKEMFLPHNCMMKLIPDYVSLFFSVTKITFFFQSIQYIHMMYTSVSYVNRNLLGVVGKRHSVSFHEFLVLQIDFLSNHRSLCFLTLIWVIRFR